MQGYEITAAETMDLLSHIAETRDVKEPAWQTISKNRRALLPYGAVAMAEVLKVMKPASVIFSVLGVREGFLYSQISKEEQDKDPLIAAADELAVLNARSPEHARELAAWTGTVMSAFGVDESVEEGRYRQAACLLADVSWRSHPDYRGLHSLNVIAQSALAGVTHPGRAYIALANYYRYEGLRDDGSTAGLASIATPRLGDLAKLLGGLMRVVYLFSAAMPGIVSRLRFEKPASITSDIDLELVIPFDCRSLGGERVEGRLQQLAKLTGKKLAFRYE
jgi:exopolyphosphatase / guanosine-5'-triphosphate,3'-diphosphate pyrophosphatase